jgi:hypothetical protein
MHPPLAHGHRRSRNRGWPTALLGVALALLLVFGFGPRGVFTRSEVCQLGPSVGTFAIWTPNDLANIPDGGYASIATGGWNYTMSSGGVTVGPLIPLPPFSVRVTHTVPASGILSDWADFNWTFFRAENASVAGGSPNPCTQAYIAQIDFPGVCAYAGAVIPISNNSTDASDPHVWNGTAAANGTGPDCPALTPGAYVWFNASFSLSNSAGGKPEDFNLCNQTGYFPLYAKGPIQVPIRVVIPFDGGEISSTGYLTWSAFGSFGDESIGYDLPAGSNWELSQVGPSSQTFQFANGLIPAVAFDRLGCSA